jgi:acyl carrier protein
MSEKSEKVLTGIWADVLGRNVIAHSDNFFDIGGDSLKAMEVISRVGERFNVQLPFITFFEDPTIRHIAATIDELGAASDRCEITRAQGRTEFPLSFSQQAFWLLAQQNSGSGLYNSQYAFRIRGSVDTAILERSVNELRRRHEILRVRLVMSPDGPVQIVDPGDPLTLVVSAVSAGDSATREQEALDAIREAVRTPFDLAAGPLLRARVVILSADECILCLVLHHTISDGFTGGILSEELGAIYKAFAAGLPSPLSDPELHFTDYALWEQSGTVASTFEGNKEYWRVALEGVPGRIALPTDYHGESQDDHRGHIRSLQLSRELSAALGVVAQSCGATLFTVFTAAFRVLLCRWTGQSDFVIGTVASNRSRVGTERMVGCFVNPLPIRNSVSERETLSDVLKTETAAVMGAFSHQDIPFAHIVEAVNPERAAGANPLFNVALLLQNFPILALGGASFHAESIYVDAERALLDLRFIVSEAETGLRVACEYKSGLFNQSTIDALLDAYSAMLYAVSQSSMSPVESLPLPESLSLQAAEARRRDHKATIVITASFTAQPLEDPLKFLLSELGMEYRVAFAPYQQVFQQLLDPASLLRSSDGVGVVLLRAEDWLYQKDRPNSAHIDDLKQLADELIEAVRAAGSGPAHLIVCFCPASQGAITALGDAATLTDFEVRVAAAFAAAPRVHIVRSGELLDLYPVSNVEDQYSGRLGNIPYTTDCFSAIASMLVRRIWGVTENRYEVIAFDSSAITLDRTCTLAQALAGFLDAGILLCLCSMKAEDALKAGCQPPNPLFEYEDFVAAAFACPSYVEGLHSLAGELALDLETFIFLHPDPDVCSDVENRCPEVLTLLVPSNPVEIPQWLNQVWAFDKVRTRDLNTSAETRGHAVTA